MSSDSVLDTSFTNTAASVCAGFRRAARGDHGGHRGMWFLDSLQTVDLPYANCTTIPSVIKEAWRNGASVYHALSQGLVKLHVTAANICHEKEIHSSVSLSECRGIASAIQGLCTANFSIWLEIYIHIVAFKSSTRFRSLIKRHLPLRISLFARGAQPPKKTGICSPKIPFIHSAARFRRSDTRKRATQIRAKRTSQFVHTLKNECLEYVQRKAS